MQIGDWMKVNGESVYASERCPFGGGIIGMTTCKGKTAYLHVLRWPGEEACIAGVKNKVKSARLLATKRKAEVVQKGDRLFLRGLPQNPPDRHDTVIALELVGKAQGC